jgi:hypothetical protein
LLLSFWHPSIWRCVQRPPRPILKSHPVTPPFPVDQRLFLGLDGSHHDGFPECRCLPVNLWQHTNQTTNTNQTKTQTSQHCIQHSLQTESLTGRGPDIGLLVGTVARGGFGSFARGGTFRRTGVSTGQTAVHGFVLRTRSDLSKKGEQNKASVREHWSGNIGKHWETSKNIEKHRETSRNIEKHRETSRNIEKHRETSRNIGQFTGPTNGWHLPIWGEMCIPPFPVEFVFVVAFSNSFCIFFRACATSRKWAWLPIPLSPIYWQFHWNFY